MAEEAAAAKAAEEAAAAKAAEEAAATEMAAMPEAPASAPATAEAEAPATEETSAPAAIEPVAERSPSPPLFARVDLNLSDDLNDVTVAISWDKVMEG